MAIEVKGKLSLDGSGWDSSLRKAGQGVETLAGEQLGGLKTRIAEAFSIGVIEEFIRRSAEMAVEIKHNSELFDVTTQKVQELTRASEAVGLSFSDVGNAISRFGRIRKEAGEHEAEAFHELQKYGLALDDIRNPLLSNIDLISMMTEKMEELGKTAQGRQELRDFFGKGGDKMVAVFRELHEMGPVNFIGDGQIDAIDQAEKGLHSLWTTIKGMGAAFIGSQLQEFGFGDDGPNKPASFGDHRRNEDSNQSASTQIFQKKENAELWKQLHDAERENREAGLSREQKITELKKEQLELAEKIKGETGDQKLVDQIQYVKNSTSLANLEHQHNNLGLKQGDSLTRTGNFLGASSNAIVSIGERTNNLLTQIRDRLPDTRQGNGTGNLIGTMSVAAN